MKTINYFFTGLMLLALQLCFANTAYASTCKLSVVDIEVLSYQGTCKDGLIDGPAEVIVRWKAPTNGEVQRAKFYGFYEKGVPKGIHIQLQQSQSRSAQLWLLFYKDDSRFRWMLTSLEYPLNEQYMEKGLWSDYSAKAKVDLNYPRLFKGKHKLPDNLVETSWLIQNAIEFTRKLGVQSMDQASIINYLTMLPKEDPLATLSPEFSKSITTIFNDAETAREYQIVQSVNYQTDLAAFKEQARKAKEAEKQSRKEFWGNVFETTLKVAGAAITVAAEYEKQKAINNSNQATYSPLPSPPVAANTSYPISVNSVGEIPEGYGQKTTNYSDPQPSDNSNTNYSGVRLPSSNSAGNKKSNAASSFVYHPVQGQCISIQAVGTNTGSKMAYGEYKLINNCNIALKVHSCIVSDRADGSLSESYKNFRSGSRCPGGYGGTELQPNEIKINRTWFEYNHIKGEFRACPLKWDIVDDNYIGSQYSCRKWK